MSVTALAPLPGARPGALPSVPLLCVIASLAVHLIAAAILWTNRPAPSATSVPRLNASAVMVALSPGGSEAAPGAVDARTAPRSDRGTLGVQPAPVAAAAPAARGGTHGAPRPDSPPIQAPQPGTTSAPLLNAGAPLVLPSQLLLRFVSTHAEHDGASRELAWSLGSSHYMVERLDRDRAGATLARASSLGLLTHQGLLPAQAISNDITGIAQSIEIDWAARRAVDGVSGARVEAIDDGTQDELSLLFQLSVLHQMVDAHDRRTGFVVPMIGVLRAASVRERAQPEVIDAPAGRFEAAVYELTLHSRTTGARHLTVWLARELAWAPVRLVEQRGRHAVDWHVAAISDASGH